MKKIIRSLTLALKQYFVATKSLGLSECPAKQAISELGWLHGATRQFVLDPKPSNEREFHRQVADTTMAFSKLCATKNQRKFVRLVSSTFADAIVSSNEDNEHSESDDDNPSIAAVLLPEKK